MPISRKFLVVCLPPLVFFLFLLWQGELGGANTNWTFPIACAVWLFFVLSVGETRYTLQVLCLLAGSAVATFICTYEFMRRGEARATADGIFYIFLWLLLVGALVGVYIRANRPGST